MTRHRAGRKIYHFCKFHFFKNQNANEKNANNYILLAQINGVSNALKNYVIDTTSKTELNYQQLQKAKAYYQTDYRYCL